MAVRAERGPAGPSPLRTVALAIGSLCAISASVTLLMTENSEYLRIAILVAVWGFVLAALAASRRQTEQAAAAGTEIELRRSYELELEREVAARREYELVLEVRLRRELQDDFASRVGALREEMINLRRELSEQWDSELRVERTVMRTQSVRLGSDRRDSVLADSAGRPYIGTTGQFPEAGEGATVGAGPYEPVPYEPAPLDRTSYEPAPYEPASYEPAPYEHRDFGEAFSAAPFDADPATSEFPAVTSVGPLVPPARPAASPIPPFPGYAAQADPDDVLTRILTETGGSTRGRRRKHRYADEDQGSGPAGF